MRSQFSIIFTVLLLCLAVSAQDAKKFTEFSRIPCGDAMQRLDVLAQEISDKPDSKIYIIYYGGRYRRHNVLDESIGLTYTKLSYPHRDDGLNFAKGVPLYLNSRFKIPLESVELKDGGFRERTSLEIWRIDRGAELPSTEPSIPETAVRFRTDKPYRVPIYADCYSGYDNF